VVVAQRTEQSLPTPEIPRLSPAIGKTLSNCLSAVIQLRKDKIKGKEAGNGPFCEKKIIKRLEYFKSL